MARASRRGLALLVSLGVVISGLTLVPAAPAAAAVVQWGTNSGTTPNYQATVNGDFVMAGNGVLACSGNALANNAGSCLNLHAASNAAAQNVNDNFAMVNSNTIAGFTTNSSSASLTVPTGATVAKAFLTWSGNTGVYTGDTRALCAGFTTARGVATLPAGSATAYRTQGIQFKVGSGAITTVAPQSMLEDPATQATSLYYSASADVTSAFAVGTGTPLTISAGNIWTPTGAGCYAGWSLTVVYDFGTYIQGNNNSVPHRVIYYEGHVREGQNDNPLTVAFNGFTAVDTGTRAGFTLFEGDRNITGDTAEYSRNGSATYTEIDNSAGDAGNFGIGRALGSTRYTQTADTSTFTNQSVDVTTSTLANVVQGDSTVNLRLSTSGDSYLLRNAILSVPTAGLQIVKTYDGTADVQARTANEKATFTIVITNTGAGTLRNIVVTDDQSDCARSLSSVVLLPLQSTTYTCTATAASAATYVSTANVTGYTLIGNYLAQDSDSTTVNLSSITLAKTSALPSGAIGRVNEVLTYTFTIRNNGSSPLTGVAVTDPLPGLSALTYSWPTATAGALAAGATATATATYTLKQSDVDSGSIVNTATTTGTDSDGGIKPTATATRTTTIAPASSIAVTKTGTLAAGATGRVGDVINYAFTFQNSGNVTLTNVVFSDPLSGLSTPAIVWPGTAGTLIPGATATVTANYTIKQTDVDAGSVKNTATVTGRTPAGATTTGSSPQVTVPTVASSPGLTTTKVGVASGNAGAGQTITYTFRATNTGNVTLTNLSIADPMAGLSAITVTGGTGTLATLLPGQFVTATATYTIKQSDVDAGSVKNVATTTATIPGGTTISAPSTQSTVSTVASNPAMTFTKSVTNPGTGKVGDVATYTFTITNSGNVTLTGATITDPLSGLSAITVTGGTGTLASIAPGQTVIATATYTLKQSDVDAGSVANTATATATPPTGANVTRTAPATLVIPPASALTVTKTGSYTTGSGAVGSVITYNFTVKNDGNQTLTQVTLADPLPGLSAITVTWPTPASPGRLLPGQTATATATYTVKQSDVDAGSVRNTATATAKNPAGGTVTGSSPERVIATVAAASSLTTTKSGVIAGGAAGVAGDVINYSFRTTNSGNVTLTNVVIADPLSGLSSLTYSWPGTVGTLAPGQFVTATATYTIKQSDVNTGSVSNTATATGRYGTATVTSNAAQYTTNTAAPVRTISTAKSGALATGATGRAGDTVNFTITLRNTGNVTLTNVGASDSLAGISAVTFTGWPGAVGTLQPNQTVTGTATYTLQQSDVDAGSVVNTATGTGLPPTGPAVTSTGPATVPVASGPAITVSKTGSITSGNGSVGDTITFNFVVRNTGNVTLTNVGITDTLADLSALTYVWPTGTAQRLAPNTQATASATYVIKQSDVNTGSVKNTATASGTPPTGAAVTANSAQVSVATAAAAPALTTTKVANPATNVALGSTVNYTITVRNTGNVTLTGVTVADTLIPSLSTTPATPATLAPNQTVVATGSYVVKQSDIDSGAVRNTATSSGTYGATTVNSTSGSIVTPTVAAAPSIALTKTGTLAAGAQGVAGDVVTYTFTSRNAGNVTLTGITITDPLSGLSAITVTGGTGSTASLAPNQTVVYTATYTLKQSDVDAGSVANTARTTGTPPTGAAVAATAPATVVIAPTASLQLTKTGSVAGPGVAGNTVTFNFTLYNPGNVTISGVTLADSLAGLSTPVINWPGATGVIPAKATVLGSATYVLQQSDVDSGSVTNTASISGKTPANATVTSPTSTATVQAAAPVRSSTTTKSASITSGARVGDVITYTINITNTGNRTLNSVALTDSLAGLSTPSITWPGAAGTLLPGQVAIAKATYVVTQADVDNGTISNQASTTATAPGNVAVTSTSAVVTTTTIARVATLSLTKSGALPAGSSARAGDVVTYTFVLRNTGNVTLTGAGVTDPLTSAPSIPAGSWPTATVGTLPPNTQVTATATYTLQQSDVNAGAVSNTATGTATPPTGPAVTTQASATIPLTSGPSITVTKTGAVTTGNGSVNDTITFDFVVRNTGNVTLTNVGIDDTLVGLSSLTYTWPGATGSLQPNTQATARATYVIKQADVNAGSVKNTATASGTPPTGPAVTATSEQVSVATVAASPTLTTNKTAIVSGTGSVNDVITYTIVGRNTGNVTLTGVTLTDPLLGLQSSQLVWSNAPGVLQPGETVSVVATYTIQQADLNNGSVENTATTRGTPPVGAEVVAPSTRVVTPTAPANPKLTVTKVGVLPAGSSGVAGDNVSWTITLKNDGNVRLTGIGVDDSLSGMSPAAFGVWPGAPNVLDPGQSVIATATYALTQSDVDAGAVSNVATGRGTPPTGATTTGTGAYTLPLDTSSSITLSKTAAYVSPGTGAVGDTVRYTFTATNTGNVTLTGVAVSDPRPGLTSITYGTWTSGTTGTLLPGRSVTATADYVVRQSDVNTGSITNTATVSGKPPTGANVSASSPTVAISTIARTASIVATKSAVVSGTGAVGDIITYTVTAQNTGSVTLTGVAIADTAPGLTPLQYGPWPGGVSGTLQPGGVVTATTTHTITQADVNAGSVPNTATATATSQVQASVTSAPATVNPQTAAANPDYSFTKSAVLAPGSTGVAGNSVNYTFTITNTGNQTLTGVTIADPHPGLSGISITWPGTSQVLQPGQTATGTATYVLTQADVDAGSVANTATANAVRPGNVTITKTSSATVPVAANPIFTITKVATVNGTGALNDTISYLITLRNPGNVTLTNVTLSDTLVGLTTPVITWPTATAGVLPPGQQATATATYTIKQADVDFGSVSNTATGTAKPPVGANLNATSGAVVSSTGNQRAELRTTKTSSNPVPATVGATIVYNFSVRNSGNVTLSNITLSDPLLGAATPTLTFPTTPGQLAPGAVATASYNYTITQSDVDAGSVVNTASSTGQTVGGTVVTSPSSTTTNQTAAADPRILVTKSGSPANVAGDVVTWTFTVSNPGNLTLTGVSLADTLPGANPVIPAGAWPSGVVGRLNPNDSFVVTSTSVVSQADVDAGAIINSVTATGTPPRGAVARSTASASVPLVPNAAISIVKTATSPTPGNVGQTVNYSFLVKNRGNVTLTGVAIDDELEGVSGITYTSWDGNPAGTLGPNDELVASATYVLTQADVDRGFVDNSATVTGNPPAGASVSDTDGARANTIAPAPQLTTTKTADRSGNLAVGDVVTYTISVENSGNTTVENVGITDSLAGLSALNYGSWESGVDGLLLPTDIITATATYTVTQADVDRGSISNTATGAGNAAVSGNAVSNPSPAVVIGTVAAAPSIVVTKSGSFASGSTGVKNDVINYTLTLKNTGNVTLDAVGFTDTLTGLTPLVYTWPAGQPANTLLPGQTVTARADYTVSQSDVDSGSVLNVGTGRGTPRGTTTAISQQAPSTVPITARGSLKAVKTGTLEAGALGEVGDEITYVVTVTNTGNVTVHDGALLDPLPGISTPVIVWPNPADPGTLPVGESVTGTAVYPLSQADVDRGFISNIAKVAAASPGSTVRDVTATTNEVIIRTVQPAPVLTVTKTAAVQGDGDIGKEIVYTFVVRNDGNVTIDDVTLTDPLDGLSPVTLSWGANTAHALAPGQQIQTSATYVIDQDDLDAGDVRNTATVSGLTPKDVVVTDSSPQVVTPVFPAAPAITVDKTGSLRIGALGVKDDIVDYSFTIENTGNVRLTAVDLADNLAGVYDVTFTAWNNGALPDGSLNPGDTATATAKYKLTQSDVDAGALVNTVSALGTPPRGSVTRGTDSATVPIAATPKLAVTKTGSLGAQTGKLGDTITYTFRIENTGNVTLSGLVLSDNLAGVTAPVITWPGTPRVLAPGQFATATATYVIAQKDIDAGTVSNTATVRAVTPNDSPYVVNSNESLTSTLARTRGIEVRKAGATDASGGVGDIVRYAIEIENTGNTTLTGVTLDDDMAGLTLSAISWPGTTGRLLPGGIARATATYTLVQADINRGFVTNSADVAGTSPIGPVDDTTGDIVTNTAPSAASIDVTKTGALAPGATGRKDDIVTFTVSLTNTGNVTVTGVAFDDALVTIEADDYVWPGTAGTLQPNQKVTATVDYVLTQADVDAGLVENTVTGTATPPTGPALTDSATTSVTIAPAPKLSPVKSAIILNDGTGAVGDVIQYTLRITNDGNVTMYDGLLVDPMIGLGTPVITWPIPGQPRVLPPGTTVVGVAEYTITQDDVDLGRISNIADVSARTPKGVLVAARSNEVIVPTVLPIPALSVTKVGTPRGDAGVNDTIDYEFRITNSGNVTLHGVTLDDPLTGVSPVAITWPGAAGELKPGKFATARATYTVTLDDVNAGAIINIAHATGLSPTNVLVEVDSATSTVSTQPIGPELTISDSGALASPGRQDVGDLVNWEYELTNTGNVTLTGIQLAEALGGVSAMDYYFWDGTPFTLRPGETVRARATTPLTQAQIDLGRAESSVTGSGTPPRGPVVTRSTTAPVLIGAVPDLAVAKSSAARAGGGLNDTIDYTFTITNTGNVTLSLIDVVDALQGVTTPVFDWGTGPEGILAPGGVVVAKSTYVVTQGDVDAGTILNTATASGKPPVGDTITASSPLNTTTLQGESTNLVITKTPTVGADRGLGDVISYDFLITNNSNVTLSSVAIVDSMPGLSVPSIRWPGAEGVLAPGASATATASYAIRQSDVDSGAAVNSATATGRTPKNVLATSAPAVATTTTDAAAPALLVEKTAELTPGATGREGDDVTYRFTVTNTGNTTLTGVRVVDPLPGLGTITYDRAGFPGGSLAPNATVTGTATYELTQDDIDSGSVANTATGYATPPSGGEFSTTGSATLPIDALGSLEAVKTGVLRSPGIGQVGDWVDYKLTITNTGNVTLYDGVLLDPLPGLTPPVITWPTPVDGVLPPGTFVTGTASVQLTQADVDLGYILNIADVRAFTPAGDPVDATSNPVQVSTVLANPGVSVTKTGTADGTAGYNDTISYEFVIRNTGNVTLGSIALTDPLDGVTTPVIQWPGAGRTLAPNATVRATATYTITQEDVDFGSVTNTADVTAIGVRGGSTSATAAPFVLQTENATPTVTITNNGVLTNGGVPVEGDTVTWTYVFTNTGNVTLSGVALTDLLGGFTAGDYAWSGTPGQLAPNGTVTVIRIQTLTQDDIDSGAVTSIVTGSGKPPVGAAATASAPATVSLPGDAALSITKTGEPEFDDQVGLGDTLSYEIVITNEGDLTLRDVTLTDALAGVVITGTDWPAAVGVLKPGESVIYAAEYTIQQEDVDRGSVTNVATANATSPDGALAPLASAPVVIQLEAPAPSITTVKSGSIVSGNGNAGSVIEYRFVVTNTGNVTLRLVNIVDDLQGISTPVIDFPGTSNILAPGGVANGVARYTITQADVDSGSVSNMATAYGTAPDGTVVSGPSNGVLIDTAGLAPAIETTHTAKLAAGETGLLGDLMDYRFVITNTGNTTLTDVAMTNNTITGLTVTGTTWPAGAGTLLPGQSVVITATRAVDQADVDRGVVRNITSATGESPTGVVVADDSAQTVVTLITPASSLDLAKVGVVRGGGAAVVGSTIDYTFTVTNTGSVTVTDVVVTDPKAGLTAIGDYEWPTATEGAIPPGLAATAHASYVVTQADFDSGSVRNTASVSGTPVRGPAVVRDTSPQSVVPLAAGSPSMAIAKTQLLTPGATGRVGDIVQFRWVVTNDGDVTLTGVTLSDAQARLGTITYTWPTGTAGRLEIGDELVATANYALTQADIDAGFITSGANTSGVSGAAVTVTDTTTGTTAIAAAPAMTIDKTSTLATTAQQGATVNYRIEVRNTGNVTLTNVDVADALVGLSTPAFTWPGTPGTLPVGRTLVVTARYTITQADVEAGTLSNTATASATAPGGAAVTPVSDTDVRDIPRVASISLTITPKIQGGRPGYAGDVVVFTYVATNTGTEPLTNVVITDPRTGLSTIVYLDWPGEPGVLLPGQSVTATATYVITRADEGTLLTETATVTSDNIDTGDPVTATAAGSVQLPTRQPDGLSITGVDPAVPLGMSLLLLLGGLGLLFVGRRKERKVAS